MEMFLPAVLSDLLGRSVSFLVQRYWQQSSVEESIEQLHLALLRVAVTVEEAEGRRITNQAMLRQLDMLRDAMYGGHYMLDALAYGQSHVVADDPAPSPCRLSSALSRLNPTKRLCFAADSTAEVQRVVDRLGCMLADMKEFVVFLKGYPRVCRQPRSAHLLLEKLMFGRQKEMEQVISFLLRGAEFGGDGVAVLPVVGPARVGKSTLVEHVCHDDRVRSHFSSILLMSGDDLEDDKLLNDPGEHGLIKHQSRASHNKCSLVILELAEDEVPDEARWRRLRSSAFCKGIGSKIIVTSRSDTEAVQRLGTEHPLRLKVLRPEAYWHYFKTLAFGSTNPEEHPRLVAIAMDICREEKGSFIGANIACSLLRANLDARFWRSILDNMREYTEKHRHLFGKHPHDLLGKNRHVYLWRLARTSKVFVSYGCYQACPAAQEDVPRMMTLQEVLSGRPAPCGRFEALAWRSHIPPCYSYLMSCSVQTPVPPHVLARKKSSRLL